LGCLLQLKEMTVNQEPDRLSPIVPILNACAYLKKRSEGRFLNKFPFFKGESEDTYPKSVVSIGYILTKAMRDPCIFSTTTLN